MCACISSKMHWALVSTIDIVPSLSNGINIKYRALFGAKYKTAGMKCRHSKYQPYLSIHFHPYRNPQKGDGIWIPPRPLRIVDATILSSSVWPSAVGIYSRTHCPTYKTTLFREKCHKRLEPILYIQNTTDIEITSLCT